MQVKCYNRKYTVISGFIGIIEGLVMIFSLGNYTPYWSLNFTIWWAERSND